MPLEAFRYGSDMVSCCILKREGDRDELGCSVHRGDVTVAVDIQTMWSQWFTFKVNDAVFLGLQ
jgi:hypothetical protein